MIKGFFTVLLFLQVLFGVGRIVHTSPQDQTLAEKAFQAGNEIFGLGKHAEALARYREGLVIAPTHPGLLYNAGLAAYLSNDFTAAAELWRRIRELYPEDWQTRTKLVQVYQALGNLEARDEERAALFERRKLGGDEGLTKEEFYCRDQFEMGGRKVMAFEHFELKGSRAIRYRFAVMDPAGKQRDFRISLGSYEAMNSFLGAAGRLKEGERVFHLDAYYQNGAHLTFGFYTPEPSYDEVKRLVIQILEDKLRPISGYTPSTRKKER